MAPQSVIYGCSGAVLTADERAFFRDACPLGFILFARNCVEPSQVRQLTEELKELAGHPHPLVLIDQEGGRVARLKPPHWPVFPAMEPFSRLAEKEPEKAREAVYLNFRLIARELHALGINVNCAPVLDLRFPGAHDIIGDRAFGSSPELVAVLARAACEGMLAGGVLPVIKHIPGHGRAREDSHLALPVVEAELAELEKTDFAPFRLLADMKLAMTAHIAYRAIDPGIPATLSEKTIRAIRETIGFKGLLLTDDLSMHALSGDFTARAKAALAAGCDILLHCNGNLKEMQSVAVAAHALLPAGKTFLEEYLSSQAPDELDYHAALRKRDALLA